MLPVVFLFAFCAFVLAVNFAFPSFALATWTSLVSSGDFTGIQTDVSTVVVAIVGIFILIAAFGILISVFKSH